MANQKTKLLREMIVSERQAANHCKADWWIYTKAVSQMEMLDEMKKQALEEYKLYLKRIEEQK